jgi:hypothetical protein
VAKVPDLDALEAAVGRFGSSVAALGEGGAGRQDVLKDVFRLNREIGRMASDFPRMRPVLREMQLEVNLTTMEVKRGRSQAAKQAAARVATSLERVRAALASGQRTISSQGI